MGDGDRGNYNKSLSLNGADLTNRGRRARKSASRAAKHMSKHSNIVKQELEKLVPRFDESEVVLGKLIGSGGFNDVYELEMIDLLADPLISKHSKKISSDLQTHARRSTAKNYRETSNFVIKFLSEETIEDPDRFCTGAADLVVEAKFLASLKHPNIVSLRGLAAAGTHGFLNCRPKGYFLLLDKLEFTLDGKIEDWKEEESTGNLKQRQNLDRNGRRHQKLLADRLQIASDIASAILYLHQNKIIYRDLKPDNIGFDYNGTVKLFDFGLAKELDDTMREGHCSEFYELSGNTGSLRYMAPEVALSEPYNLTADVYSFGLLLWQISSLQIPYDGMSRAQHSRLVVKGGTRPELDSSWSTPLRILIKRSWESDPSIRPSMDSSYNILKREADSLRKSNYIIEKTVRRSLRMHQGSKKHSKRLPSYYLASEKRYLMNNLYEKQYSSRRVSLVDLRDQIPRVRSSVAA